MMTATKASSSGNLTSKLEDYEIIEKIGRGKYSQVFLSINMLTKEQVVLKILNPIRNAKFRREIHVLKKLQDGPHIMKLREVLNNPISRVYTIVSL